MSRSRDEEILSELRDFEQRLAKMPKEQQKIEIDAKREDLMGIVRRMLAGGNIPIVGAGMNFLMSHNFLWCDSAVNLLIKIFGFDPLKWLYFEEYNYNASLANKAYSNPSLYNAINEAARILDERNMLMVKEEHFSQSINTANDADGLVESILAFCKCISAPNVEKLLLNPNDLKTIFSAFVKLLLNKEETEHNIQWKECRPVIYKGYCSWVSYDLKSDLNVREDCCSKNKYCKVDIKMKYFVYPSEADFRQALRQHNI